MLNDAFFQVLREAGDLMLSYENLSIHWKDGHANFVTEADEAVQSFLQERLHALLPSAAFLGEEGGKTILTDELTIIVDPIDGTTNYYRNRCASAISVGITAEKKPVAGMVLDPYRQRIYHAEKGCGAYCNDAPIHVSDFPMERALIEFGSSPYRTELNALTGLSVAALLPRTADLRRSGSAALDLCNVACGISEGLFEWDLQPWDHCAASVIVEEAGGRCGCITGGDAVYDHSIPFVAGNAICFEPLRELLNGLWITHHP